MCVSRTFFLCQQTHSRLACVQRVFSREGISAPSERGHGVRRLLHCRLCSHRCFFFFGQTATAVGTGSSRSIVFLAAKILFTLYNATFSTTVESLLVAMTSKDIQQALEICFFCKKQSVGYLFHRAPYWFFPLFVLGGGELDIDCLRVSKSGGTVRV